MMKVKSVILLICFIILTASSLAARERIVIGTGLKPPLVESETHPGFLETLVTDAFRRIGIDLEIIILPAGRVLINANRGIEDGCLLRIKGLEAKYPNLVRVPEMLMVSEFVAYSAVSMEKGSHPKKFNPYSISYITGWQIFDRLFSEHPAVTRVKDADQMFSLIKTGRVDVVLYERWQGLWILKQENIKGIQLVQPPLVSMDMFMYLHKRHRDLVPKLAAELLSMKKDGTYGRYYDKYLNSLTRQ